MVGLSGPLEAIPFAETPAASAVATPLVSPAGKSNK